MKFPIIILVILAFYHPLQAQESPRRQLLQTKNKLHLYYVDMTNAIASVYEMGSYLDKAGRGFSIRLTDTLGRQADGSYLGQNSKIIAEHGQFFLVSGLKNRKFPLDTVTSPGTACYNLNNAYYLDHYFDMSNELNRQYPLNHHSFRNGYFTWKELSNKEMDYVEFREFTHSKLKEIRDSIAAIQERYVALTNYIAQRIGNIDYNTLRDSLSELPAGYNYSSRYYGKIVNELALQRPDYFFRLAGDFPQNRGLIFNSVQENKETIRGLKGVEGYDTIKKEFFKERRFGRTLPYKIIGTYAVVGGIIALLIVSQ